MKITTLSSKWNSLPNDVGKHIESFRFVHPTALLMKDLEFVYIQGKDPFMYFPPRLVVLSQNAKLNLICSELYRPVKVNCRQYFLQLFGDPLLDRYQILSDRRSNIRLGRMEGDVRWGHELGDHYVDPREYYGILTL